MILSEIESTKKASKMRKKLQFQKQNALRE